MYTIDQKKMKNLSRVRIESTMNYPNRLADNLAV